MKRSDVLFVVGFSAEAALLPPDARIICAAANPARLDALLAEETPAALLSFGIAGALDPGLSPGALIAASAVIAGHAMATDASWTRAIAAATGARIAPIAGSDSLVPDAAAKTSLMAATGAAAVDMESQVVARHARRLGVPFAVLRAIADTADEAIPRAAANGLDAAGNPAPWQVMRGLLRRPQDLPGVIRLARRSRAALSALADAAPRIPLP